MNKNMYGLLAIALLAGCSTQPLTTATDQQVKSAVYARDPANAMITCVSYSPDRCQESYTATRKTPQRYATENGFGAVVGLGIIAGDGVERPDIILMEVKRLPGKV